MAEHCCAGRSQKRGHMEETAMRCIAHIEEVESSYMAIFFSLICALLTNTLPRSPLHYTISTETCSHSTLTEYRNSAIGQ